MNPPKTKAAGRAKCDSSQLRQRLGDRFAARHGQEFRKEFIGILDGNHEMIVDDACRCYLKSFVKNLQNEPELERRLAGPTR